MRVPSSARFWRNFLTAGVLGNVVFVMVGYGKISVGLNIFTVIVGVVVLFLTRHAE